MDGRGWGLGTGCWALAEKGLPVAGAFQHRWPNLFSGSREPTQPEKNSFSERTGNVYENKGSAFHERERSGNIYEKTGT
jgi:hypothetical protein